MNFSRLMISCHTSNLDSVKKHSCETALTEIIDQWLHSMHCGEFTGLLFIDFRKAFDLVDHSILLKKTQNLSKWSECSQLVQIIPR